MSTFETPRRHDSVDDYVGDTVVRTRRLEGALPDGQYEIKLTPSETDAVVVGNGWLIFMIPRDLHGAHLLDAAIYQTTVGTGPTLMQIRNVDNGNVDMLNVQLTIDSGEKNSYDAAVQPVVDMATDLVRMGDHIAIDIDAVATGSLGHGIVITFGVG